MSEENGEGGEGSTSVLALPESVGWNQWTAGSLSVQRYAVKAHEWITVNDACVLVCDAMPVLIVDGVLRLNGVVKGA